MERKMKTPIAFLLIVAMAVVFFPYKNAYAWDKTYNLTLSVGDTYEFEAYWPTGATHGLVLWYYRLRFLEFSNSYQITNDYIQATLDRNNTRKMTVKFLKEGTFSISVIVWRDDNPTTTIWYLTVNEKTDTSSDITYSPVTVEINETNFPDQAYRENVKRYDKNGDGWLSSAERNVDAYTGMMSYGNESFKGIEYFETYEWLELCYGKFATLTLGSKPRLKTLWTYGGKAEWIDISECPYLKTAVQNGTITIKEMSGNSRLPDGYKYRKIVYDDVTLYIDMFTDIKANGIVLLAGDKSYLPDDEDAQVEAVITQIKDLPDSVSVSDKETVAAARETYDALTDDQKALIGEDVLKKLTDAETKVKGVEKEQDEEAGDKITVSGGIYKLNHKTRTAVMTEPEKKTAKALTIQDTVTANGITYEVTEIAANACKGMSKLTKVTIGKNVTKIGKKAFYGDKKLTTISGGKGLVTINAGAFQNCTKLKTVPVFSKLVTIGDSAFQGCTTLAKFTIGAKVKEIGKKAFYGDKKLKTITIKTTLLTASSVKSNAFKGINSGATIKCPQNKLKNYTVILLKKGITKTMIIK